MQRIKKEARIDIRLTLAEKSLIEQAATLSGIGLTDFVIMALQEYAINSIEKHKKVTAFLASKIDQEIFFEAIMNPPEPNDALKAAAEKFKTKWN